MTMIATLENLEDLKTRKAVSEERKRRKVTRGVDFGKKKVCVRKANERECMRKPAGFQDVDFQKRMKQRKRDSRGENKEEMYWGCNEG